MGKGMPAATANSWVLNGHNMYLYEAERIQRFHQQKWIDCIDASVRKCKRPRNCHFGWGKWCLIPSPIFRQTQTGGVPFPSSPIDDFGGVSEDNREHDLTGAFYAGNFREWSITSNNNPSNPQQPIHSLRKTHQWLSTTGWWFGTWLLFFPCFPIVGMMVQSDFYIFQEVGISPIIDKNVPWVPDLRTDSDT